MKKLILILCLLTIKLNAQVSLQFDKRFIDCEDKWVILSMKEDSTHIYGFVYLDEEAGLTFNREGNFKYNPDKTIKIEKQTNYSVKIRIEPTNVKVAVIPEAMYKDLEIEKTPDWLKFYKSDTVSVKRLYRLGYTHNAWNECEKALTFLTKAKEKNPTFNGLNVELAFSYNCLKKYDQAEEILTEEILINPTDAYVNKEYIYTLAKNKKIEKATQQFKSSIRTLKDDTYNAENCYNILQYFYYEKDKKNFQIWYKEFSKHSTKNEAMKKYADNMKSLINK